MNFRDGSGNERTEIIDRVKKSFPNYHREVDELFARRSDQLDQVSFSTIGKLRGLDTVTLTGHEFTHSIFGVADQFSNVDLIHDPNKAVDRLGDFIGKVDTGFRDRSEEAHLLRKQKLLKVGEETLDISTYSKRIEDSLFDVLSYMAGEEARANTGANLLGRLAYGKDLVTDINDTYNVIGGFKGYMDVEDYTDNLLRMHPAFGSQEVEVGDRGARVLKPMEDFPELLEQFDKTKKEISLRVDMRVNAEYLGQLGEFGGGYSKGPKGIQAVMAKNAQDIFDRAYNIHGRRL